MALPVDFEEKAKLPPAANGAGYPYRLSARDLMRNFVFAAVTVPPYTKEGITNGIKEVLVTGQGGHTERQIYAEGLPAPATAGDMLYYDGTSWALLPAPSSSGTYVLTSVNGVMQWIEPETCP